MLKLQKGDMDQREASGLLLASVVGPSESDWHESRVMVTGPSFSNETCIICPKAPSAAIKA